MKHIRLYYMMSILLLCVCQCGLAENRLIESSTQKSKVYVYRLDGKLWCKLHNDRESFDPESYKNSCVLVSEPDVAMPELPRGNYISISGIGNEVRQHYFTVDTIYMELVERAERHLKVYDKRGNDVKGLKVKRDKRRCRYDEQMQAYNLGKSMRSSYITVDNGGVYHMLEYENGNGVYDELNSFGENVVVFFEQVGDFFSKLYWNVSHRLNYKKNRNAYNSFMVFSKPKYKPNEELKLKIYLCDRTGKPYNKAVNLKLKNFRYGVDTIFVKGLQPYNPGMYSGEVPLSEGLGLKVDNSY